MSTKFFKITCAGDINLTEKNLSTLLRRWFCDDFKVKELFRARRVVMDVVKKIRRTKRG